jgi:hypothetical protein
MGIDESNSKKTSTGFGICVHAQKALVDGVKAHLFIPVLCDACMAKVPAADIKLGKRLCGHDRLAVNASGIPVIVRGKECVCKEGSA